MNKNFIKKLLELRNAKVEELEALVKATEEEKRVFTEEEDERFKELTEEIEELDGQIKKNESIRNYEPVDVPADENSETEEERELREFAGFVRNGENREFTAGDNGDIIPVTIANKIIEKVKELSPIYSLTTQFHVGGDLKFPVYEEGLTTKYVEEFEELTESSGKFTTVDLKNHIVGVLTKISKSMVNRTDIDLVNFVVQKVAESISVFLENELINGKTRAKGLATIAKKQLLTAGSSTAITADDLIKLQLEVSDIYQGSSRWLMTKETLGMLRTLKDKNGNYLLNKDLNQGYGFELLGRPVETTTSMAQVKAGVIPIYYGDFSGLYTKFANELEMQILKEKYATQYAIGIVGHMEFDSGIVEPEKFVGLKMGS